MDRSAPAKSKKNLRRNSVEFDEAVRSRFTKDGLKMLEAFYGPDGEDEAVLYRIEEEELDADRHGSDAE